MAENGSDTLSPAQRRAVLALLDVRNRTVGDAAKAANVGERTLHRWLDDPTFVIALDAAGGQAIDAATRRLLGLQDPAIMVITGIMADRTASATVRLRAAQIVIESMMRLRELRNIERRIALLEAQLDDG